ncbi:MAG: hypothetical protein LC650_05585 [Actinobacteria bacterium]|nr:hypothetical protein [Actinomycetota bacterium]
MMEVSKSVLFALMLILANVLGILAGVMAFYGIAGWGWFLTATVVVAFGAMEAPILSVSASKNSG